MSDMQSDPSPKSQTSASHVNTRNSVPTDTAADTGQLASTASQAVQLDTGQGRTIIADGVVSKIAAMAAREIEGVHDLVAIGSPIAGFAGRLTRGDQRATGVNVEVGHREAAVDLNMTVDYGVSIPHLAAAVRQNIMDRVQSMTGLVVKEVNINAADLFFPGEDTSAQSRVQ
jgi:uncharacterized alkaline shock family protein YloU